MKRYSGMADGYEIFSEIIEENTNRCEQAAAGCGELDHRLIIGVIG